MLFLHNSSLDIILKSYLSKNHFDNGLYSEPLATMNLLYDYEHAKNKPGFAHTYSLSYPRLKQLHSTVHHLQSRVASAMNQSDSEIYRIKIPPREMPGAKLTALRLLNIFTFPEFIVTSKPRAKVRNDGSYHLTFTNAAHLEDEMLHKLLDPNIFGYSIERKKKNIYTGYAVSDDTMSEIGPSEQRLLSYGLENNFQVILIHRGDDCVHAYIPEYATEQPQHIHGAADCASPGVLRYLLSVEGFAATSTITCHFNDSTNTRGIRGRACGLWTVTQEGEYSSSSEKTTTRLISVHSLRAADHEEAKNRLKEKIKAYAKSDVQVFGLLLSVLRKNTIGFVATTYGDSKGLSSQDGSDLFLSSNFKMRMQDDGVLDSVDIKFFPANNANKQQEVLPSLVDDIPLGARILASIASGHRKKHVLALTKESDGNEVCVELQLPKPETRFVERWFTLGSKSKVYVDNCSIPASADDMKGCQLFVCCANYLELNGGLAKVDGLTMLPPNPCFIALALSCVGIEIPQHLVALLKNDQKDDPGDFVSYKERVDDALLFNLSCQEHGDSLACDFSLIKELCSIFDLEPWIHASTTNKKKGFKKK